MADQGMLIVISGFSGVGKGTVVKELTDHHPGYALSVSVTTRKRRENEVHGVHYFFISEDEFHRMKAEDELIESTCYVGNYYGSPRKFVEEKLAEGKDIILEIEIEGALNIRRMFPDALLIFIMPPSAEALFDRLSKRGTEGLDVIESRIERAVEESEGIENYDYVFVNDVASDCADRIHQLILSEKTKTRNNEALIRRIRREIHEFRDQHRKLFKLQENHSENEGGTQA